MFTSKAYRSTSKYALALTLPLAILVAATSIYALITPNFYRLETEDWVKQSTAQDVVDLFLVLPVLMIAGLFVHRGERLAEPMWGGSLLYLIYTFIIYCFNIHFNQLFLVYVGALGISVWAFIYFIRQQQRMQTIPSLSSTRIARVVSIYFIAVAIIFYALWLADVIQALAAGRPSNSLVAAGLTTNPVHVLDLSVVLPGIFITGLLLYRQHPIGLMLTPVILVFFMLMDITIAIIFMAQQKESMSNLPGTIVMSLLTVWSLVALLWFLKNGKPEPGNDTN